MHLTARASRQRAERIARLAVVLAATTCSPFLQSEATSAGMEDHSATAHNVILITWDGVRPEEFAGTPDAELAQGDSAPLLPYFWSELAGKGQIYGLPGHGPSMLAGNAAFMSLPGYQAILAGRTQRCQTNECGRIREETFGERLRRLEGSQGVDVAAIASWEKMAFAEEHTEGSLFVNAGMVPMNDGSDDPVLRAINEAQAADPPDWEQARRDVYTHQLALRYLELHQPRFLHIGLNDTDEWGHRANYPMHMQSLRSNDAWLRELVEKLATLGEYGKNTCILLTTDHGRGDGSDWPKHSNGVPSSGRVWLYASCPLSDVPVSFLPRQYLTTHLDIRPTIEALLGIEPRQCFGCGTSLLSH